MYWAGPKTSLGRKGGGEEGRAAAEEGREASGQREREREREAEKARQASGKAADGRCDRAKQ
jgi:hypothetical protein